MIIRVDIDGTLCNKTYGKYDQAKPIRENIEKVNALYEQGHVIIIWTARNQNLPADCTKFTKKQLAAWGVKYHRLSTSKPEFDILFDDKAMQLEEYTVDE